MTIAPIQRLDDSAQSTAVKGNATRSKAPPPTEDTVHLSGAAIAALLAKPPEATETAAQTIQEAGGGDPKALALLAKSKH